MFLGLQYKLTLINRLQQNTVKNTDALVFYNVTKNTSIWHLQMLSLIITLIPHFFKNEEMSKIYVGIRETALAHTYCIVNAVCVHTSFYLDLKTRGGTVHEIS